MEVSRNVLVTGGTGYIGKRLVPALVERGHRVRVLSRAASVSRVPHGAEAVIGDALSTESVASALLAGDTLVHLVGTPHPSPAKAAEFQRVDLASIQASVAAARERKIDHLVYVSVAQPAPAMHAYIAVRAAGEKLIVDGGIRATVLRPWYVLGPGHWWPVVLVPMYAIAELIPSLRDGARRLGLVTIAQMVKALVRAVEEPSERGVRVIDVEGILGASYGRTLGRTLGRT
jgi:uncharacterized protein YbjT (DUF2867 family)